MEAELLSTLLVCYPNPVAIKDLVEIIYPDPDVEPEYPEIQVEQSMRRLSRKVGTFRIGNCGRSTGYRLYQIPSDAKFAA